jgi:methionyl-tRNA formyltransferase
VTRVRTVFLGSGQFGVPALRLLARHADVDLVGVATAPPRPAGRRRELTPTPIDAAATALGIVPILRPARLRDPAAIASVVALAPALAVLADYGQIVPPAILGLKHGALNLHPSLLPRHRGASPIQAAILADDAETGVTLFRMDEGLDTGPIVAQERLALDGTETAPVLEERLGVLAASLLGRSLGSWIRGDLPERPQPIEGGTLTRLLRRDDGRLDPVRPAGELERQVRAYAPWPGSFVDLPEGRLVVHAAHVEPAAPGDRGDAPIAQVVVAHELVAHDQGIALVTPHGRLVLDEVQPAGGRRMSGSALRRGRPTLVGGG